MLILTAASLLKNSNACKYSTISQTRTHKCIRTVVVFFLLTTLTIFACLWIQYTQKFTTDPKERKFLNQLTLQLILQGNYFLIKTNVNILERFIGESLKLIYLLTFVFQNLLDAKALKWGGPMKKENKRLQKTRRCFTEKFLYCLKRIG